MSRGVGAIEALRAILPVGLVPAFAVITQLGDAWFLFLVVTLYYWFGSRYLPDPTDRPHAERGAFLLALALGALALTVSLKSIFELPRPPATLRAVVDLPDALRPLYEAATIVDGFGFPSGHALGSAVIYGGLAQVLNVSTRRRRFAAAGVVVFLVSLSRLVLGVHYLVDVLVGVLVGAAYLAVGIRISDRSPRPAFLLAALVAVVGLFFSASQDIVALLGATAGAALVWERVAVPERPSRAVVPAALVGLPLLGGLWYLAYRSDAGVLVLFAASALVIAGVLSLPVLASRAAGRRGAADE